MFVATLGSTLPVTRFSPQDADNDLDNKTAENASRANAQIERWNNAKRLLKQRLCYLGVAGVYFRHTRYVRDARICGSKKEPIEQMQPRQVGSDHYICPQCATSTDANQGVASSQFACPNCGYGLGPSDYYPALWMNVPVVSGWQDVPQGQVRQTVYNNLHFQISPFDSESGADDEMLRNTPIGNLAIEVDQAALRSMWPDEWNAIQGSGESAGSPEGELDRMARLRSQVPGFTRGSALMSSGQLPTYERTWIQPIAYGALGKKEDADSLKKQFPNGVCVYSVNGAWLGCRQASLTDEWTMCTTGLTGGPNPPAVLEAAMDIQDRINDTANTQHEYFDRMAVPPILYNSKLITKGLSGRYLSPSSLLGVNASAELGHKLQDAFFQPEFHMDNSVHNYLEALMMLVQLLTGITPQMYGGTQKGIETSSGQKQALDVATGVMRLYWDQVREEDAQAAKISVRCLAESATDDILNPIMGDTGPQSFKNDKIEIENLKGEFLTYPDEEQGYPVSFEETRAVLEKIIEQSAQNPLIQEMFQPMANRRFFAKYLAPGLQIPGEKQHYKVLNDIGKLLASKPIQTIDQQSGFPTMIPAVMPDRDFDDMEIVQEVVKEFAVSNHDLEKTQPLAFQNLRLYFRLAVRFQKELVAEAQSPVMPTGGGGVASGALPAAGQQGPPQGAPQPALAAAGVQ